MNGSHTDISKSEVLRGSNQPLTGQNRVKKELILQIIRIFIQIYGSLVKNFILAFMPCFDIKNIPKTMIICILRYRYVFPKKYTKKSLINFTDL